MESNSSLSDDSCLFVVNNPLMLLICSIIGGAVVILGLYMLLWGKGKDQIDKSSTEHESDQRDGDWSEASYAVP